jgi:hypothetical protein
MSGQAREIIRQAGEEGQAKRNPSITRKEAKEVVSFTNNIKPEEGNNGEEIASTISTRDR